MVFTESGGIQEGTSVLGIPCITLRDTTERPITTELGTNQVVGSDPKAILAAWGRAMEQEWEPAQIPLWDGKAAQRVLDILIEDLSAR